VAIKLEYMPQVIMYNENKNTVNAISWVLFFCLLYSIISRLAAIRKKGVITRNTQLLVLNSGKFCALVRLAGKTTYSTLIMIFNNKNMILAARTAIKFWYV
jgi:predicted alpha/beta-fold hydrolase